MVWIAGQSKCTKVVSAVPDGLGSSFTTDDGKSFTPQTWLEETPDCTEKAKVFTFVTESFTITTANLVFFGVVKAVFNFVTGVCCDRFGRKWTLTVGWLLAIPMPFMVLYADTWWTVATSNIFLGMQQALVWSATIFIMVDYLGQENSGAAIGLNETIGYTTIAIVTVIAGAVMDEDAPRGACYWVVLAIICANVLIAIFALKESRVVSVQEEAELTSRAKEDVETMQTVSLTWPSKRTSELKVFRASFIYTSFVNTSLMSICFAGLMINFISGFAWGIFKKWMKGGHSVDGEVQWDSLSKEDVANVVLCYGVLKGTLQWIFGFVGDRIGRKWLVVGGLSIVVTGLIVVAITGASSGDPFAGFVVGALLMGAGTGIMYTNNLAAICDHSDPSWRSSALGAYRFWRDMGYAVGALVTGAAADSMGMPWSVGMTAILTTLAALGVAIFYTEVPGANTEQPKLPASEDKVEPTLLTSEAEAAKPQPNETDDTQGKI
jgi:MFS family permease